MYYIMGEHMLMNGVLLNVCLLHQSATYGSTAITLATSLLDVHVLVGSYVRCLFGFVQGFYVRPLFLGLPYFLQGSYVRRI